MSYSRQTTHYGIPLPEETDLVNGLDWNTSSELIDSAVYEASEAASSAATDIVAIKATLVNLHDADVQFQQDLNGVAGRVSTLEQNATLDEEAIQDIADMITDKEVTQAQSDVHIDVGEWFRYNGVLYVCTVEININDTIIPNTNCRATNIEDEMLTAGDTRYDINSGKMQYYDGTTWQDVPAGGGSMVALDFSNPVKTFAASDTYTAQDGDYLHIAFMDVTAAGERTTVMIDGKSVATTLLDMSNGYIATGVYTQKLAAGQIITTDQYFSTGSKVYILREA